MWRPAGGICGRDHDSALFLKLRFGSRWHGAETIIARRMLTQDILFGMNLLTLAGFIVMGLSLTLHRMAAAGRPLSVGLMCAGTALVFLGLYVGSLLPN
jgi:hypothetical protein